MHARILANGTALAHSDAGALRALPREYSQVRIHRIYECECVCEYSQKRDTLAYSDASDLRVLPREYSHLRARTRK